MNEWYRQLDIDVPQDQFDRLPRHPAYDYGWWDGQGHLQPSPKLYHGLLPLDDAGDETTLATRSAEAGVRLRSVEEEDWPPLVDLFDAAFRGTVPYCTLETDARHDAAYESLRRTRQGGDGPLVNEASSVAVSGNELLGAILITLIPTGNLERFDEPGWTATAPSDAVDQRWGRPHVTWVFVAPKSGRKGIGSLLLRRSVEKLGQMGHRDLASTFCPGNVASLLWHWRSGFRLLSWPGTPDSDSHSVAGN
ncbi:Acetyltransferase (GNAT) family protein [Maioricimonas rarisocia]|uniref:Acetyltransferase (GNAT) family protein n=1 Tax=Maioricimonas rarisocia TaxID=2528026 RepID=A0A517ZB85_9PLAN|nr:GNAT family N-acetyltransferase [Maioricimonas rarisocia]QDU39765.1 Acetyltransferase (GNAT) family protein [Maioricimonas rarisocia]